MSIDMVLVFNRLTCSELADCTLFEQVLDKHYEKFRYFYSMVEHIDIMMLDKIKCEEQDICLDIIVECPSVAKAKEFLAYLETRIDDTSDSYYAKRFRLSISADKKRLNISIESKLNL